MKDDKRKEDKISERFSKMAIINTLLFGMDLKIGQQSIFKMAIGREFQAHGAQCSGWRRIRQIRRAKGVDGLEYEQKEFEFMLA